MMKWITVSEKYLSHLRTAENRIPHSDYGKNKFKPFFGVLFETNGYYYVTQVSSAKDRHHKMKQNLDFYKLYEMKYAYPQHPISKRCLDFKALEIIAENYIPEQQP